MSTRQHRISDTQVILSKTETLKGKTINVVLKDRTVIPGVLRNSGPAFLELLNMRLKNVKIPVDKIYEIYYDTKE